MKRSLLLALAVSLAACSPDITSSPSQANNFVVAEFDPVHSVIPLPNDLVFLDASGHPQGTLQAPTTGGTDAQNEFNRDYLNHLDGFPLESTASVLFDKPIDPATVVPYNGTNPDTATIAVTDVSTSPPTPVSNLTISVADAGTGQTLSFIPATGTWERGHHYAVLLLGGANGIKGKTSGQTVTPSPTFALVTSSTPLITCDTNGNNCIVATGAIPTTAKDPAAQYDQQVAAAKQLEALRVNYKPILDGAQAQLPSLKRTDIALVWTFTITSQSEVTFDPGNLIIPFPNDILNPTGSQVAIPDGSGLPPALVAGLNTLDGFSTTAPILSENGIGTGPLLGGRVDASTLKFGSTGTINFVAAGPGSAALPTTLDGLPKVHACLNCPGIVMTQPDGGPIVLPDGGPKPDTLAIIPDLPLTERTLYAAYITTELRDLDNKDVAASPAFALVRSSAPLFDGTHSTVSLLTDAQASQLEQLRVGLKPFFDQLTVLGVPRTKLALAWAFHTQSTITTLSQLHGAPLAAPAQTALPLWVQEIPAPAGAPNPGGVVGHWYIGQLLDLFALTGTGGTINPNTAQWTAPKIAFVMSVPATSAPASGYPVTIFGHGLTRERTDAFAMSASLAAANNVMVAIDEPWHGDRNTCTGFGALLLAGGADPNFAKDQFACVNPNPLAPTQNCNAAGHCELADRNNAGLQACDHTALDADKACMLAVSAQFPTGQGHCAADDKCEGGAFASSFGGVPIQGWNLINLQNFFATRDNLRQQVISNSQLARIASNAATGNLGQQAGDITIDGTKISYAGQSLGGILGSLYSASAPEVKNAALNVPGGGLTNIILTSPAFAQLKNAFQGGLAAQGVETNSPLYDQFLGIVQWIVDPADPLNAGPYLVRSSRAGTFDPLTNPLANNGSTRRGFIQWIDQDQVVPNPSTVDLIQSVMADPTANGVLVTPSTAVPRFWAKQFPSNANTALNHGFLLGSAGAATAQQAQGEIANFIAGAAPF